MKKKSELAIFGTLLSVAHHFFSRPKQFFCLDMITGLHKKRSYLRVDQWLKHLLSVFWLTNWLTDSSVRIRLLKTWQRRKKHTQAKPLQGFRQQVTWPTLLGGNNLDHVNLKGNTDIKVKKHQPFYSEPCVNLARVSY